MTPEWAGVIIAAIGAVGGCTAAFLSAHNSSKLNNIHMLVNSNLRRVEKALEAALAQVRKLEAQKIRRR